MKPAPAPTTVPIRRWYPLLYVVCIAEMSAQTLVHALLAGPTFVVWLAAVEIVAAIGILPEKTRAISLFVLLGVYATAAGIHLHAGDHSLTYLVFYAGSLFVAVRMLSEGPSSDDTLAS